MAGLAYYNTSTLVNRLVVLLILICFLLGCNKVEDEKIQVCQPNNIDCAFESDLEEWKNLGGSGERAFEGDIAISQNHASSGKQSVQFTITDSSYIARGNRAELTFDDAATEGCNRLYEFKLFIPNDYPDVYMQDADGEPNWQLMGQWHQQPVISEGQDWDGFTGQGESPPIAWAYYYLHADDPFLHRLRNDTNMLKVPGFNASLENVSILMLTYGLPPIPVGLKVVEKGQWIEIKTRVLWSQQPEGEVQGWINGQPTTPGPVYGPNMWNRASHYFKFGLYRNPDINYTQVLYYDDIKIGDAPVQ